MFINHKNYRKFESKKLVFFDEAGKGQPTPIEAAKPAPEVINETKGGLEAAKAQVETSTPEPVLKCLAILEKLYPPSKPATREELENFSRSMHPEVAALRDGKNKRPDFKDIRDAVTLYSYKRETPSLDSLKTSIESSTEKIAECLSILENMNPPPSLTKLLDAYKGESDLFTNVENLMLEEKKIAIKEFLNRQLRKNGIGKLIEIKPGSEIIEHFEADKKKRMEAHTEIRVVPATLVIQNEEGIKSWSFKPVLNSDKFEIRYVSDINEISKKFDGTIPELIAFYKGLNYEVVKK